METGGLKVRSTTEEIYAHGKAADEKEGDGSVGKNIMSVLRASFVHSMLAG